MPPCLLCFYLCLQLCLPFLKGSTEFNHLVGAEVAVAVLVKSLHNFRNLCGVKKVVRAFLREKLCQFHFRYHAIAIRVHISEAALDISNPCMQLLQLQQIGHLVCKRLQNRYFALGCLLAHDFCVHLTKDADQEVDEEDARGQHEQDDPYRTKNAV